MRPLIVGIALVAVTHPLVAQTAARAKTNATAKTPADSFALGALLPRDPAVRTGTLLNGLRYYVRRNAKPEQRAELRLVVNAGSILEDND